jgi:uncharacterized protein YoxC
MSDFKKDLEGRMLLQERLTRMEERLIAEKSVRKTRDDQLFKFVSQVHTDIEKQDRSLGKINSDVEDMGKTMSRIEESLKNQTQLVHALGMGTQDNRDAIKHIQGSIKTMKWVWPLIITLVGVSVSLIIANIDLKNNQIQPAPPEIVKEEKAFTGPVQQEPDMDSPDI